ncbi:MAG: hypothetical protein E6G92_06710 [Alphaproteobacteria bacterium]|nr:MAG: hypothetical protein E6G92_06710 [Alphaproteobacteria bacterium]
MGNSPEYGANLRNIVLGLFITATCGACTHLQTNPTGDVPSVAGGAASTAGAQRGLSYALPMVQYHLKISRSLDSCPDDRPPTFATKVEASERYVAGERFEVDYQVMSSILKTTNFEMTWHESGTIRTVNARAQDQTGTVLTNLARIGLSVASAAGGVPIAPAAFNDLTASTYSNLNIHRPAEGPVPIVTLRCSAAARADLAELKQKTDAVTALTPVIAGLNADVVRLSALASLEVMLPADQAELSAQVHTLMLKEQELRTLVDQIATLQARLSASDEVDWPVQPSGPGAHSATIGPDQASLRRLMTLLEIYVDGQRMDPQPADLLPMSVICRGIGEPVPASRCLSDLAALSLGIVPSVSQDSHPARTADERLNSSVIPPSDRRWARGIFIREPIDGRLIVCAAPEVVAGQECTNGTRPVLRDEPLIAPQLGRLRLLPFRSRAFENNELKLSMRANGFVEQFSYGEESSAAAATGTAADIAERYQVAQEARETERRSDIQYARDTQTYLRNEAAASRAEQLAQLTNQRDLLIAQRDLLTTQTGVPDQAGIAQLAAEKARIDGEVALVQSQIARLRAATELAGAQAARSP